MSNRKEETFCGHKKVSFEEKKTFVNKIFSNVSGNYDLMNNVMSFGLHHLWKNKFVSLMNKCLIYKKEALILDLASGSGDIALKFLKQNNDHHVIFSDINKDMLDLAQQKIFDNNLFQSASYLITDAAHLPIEDNSLDLVTISFGMRNVAEMEECLREIYRTLKPYSYFLCMEFSPIEGVIKQNLYNLYARTFIPFVGKHIAHDEAAYQYLVESIETFPRKENFKQMIEEAGLQNVKYYELNFGNVAIHMGQKI